MYDLCMEYVNFFALGCSFVALGLSLIAGARVGKFIQSTQDTDWETLANQALVMKKSLSIKTTTYNAAPFLGRVNWLKNVKGIDATKDMYPSVKGVNYDA